MTGHFSAVWIIYHFNPRNSIIPFEIKIRKIAELCAILLMAQEKAWILFFRAYMIQGRDWNGREG
jgi:hypothetical protein